MLILLAKEPKNRKLQQTKQPHYYAKNNPLHWPGIPLFVQE